MGCRIVLGIVGQLNVRYSNPKFWRLVRKLRVEMPANHPVIIRTVVDRVDSANLWLMQRDGMRWYLAHISRGELTQMKDALCHEWAHILDWHDSSVSVVVRKRREHTARWGAIYAKCYRLVFETEN